MAFTPDGIAPPSIPLLGCSPPHNDEVQNGLWGRHLCHIHCYVYMRLYCSVRIAGGLGGVNPPYLILPTPYLWSKFDPGGVEFQPPHLSFAEVDMLFPSHFLLMQFLKYLQCDDLNVTTILIHIED